MISVAMTTYNGEKYIIKQLESIKNQTVKVDEIILVDDCSKDSTTKVVKDYISDNLKYCKLIKNESNMGFIKSFKKAISLTKGDIIILCDHDDIWYENKVEVIKNTFDSNKSILALATSFVKIDEYDKIINEKVKFCHANNNLIRHRVKKNDLNKMNFKDVAVYNISPGCTCAFSSKIKKELLENNYQIPHDLQIMIIAALKKGLYYLDKVTTKYRIYNNNTIGLTHESNYEKRLKLVKGNFKEKKELAKLTKKMDCTSNEEKLINKIVNTFKLREELLKTKKMFKYGLKALIGSIGLNKLYESVMMDLLTILKNK